MLRRILVGLDPSEFSGTAVRVSCFFARPADAVVVGLGVVDEPSIRHAEYGGAIGADHYAHRAEEHRLKEAHAEVSRLVRDFERACAEAGVRSESHIRTGSPPEEILNLANGADLLVSGNRTFFGFATREGPDDTLEAVLRAHVVPVLALPAGVEPPFRRAVIACDSSASSVRALRSFVYQSWDRPSHPEIVLLRVDDDHDEGVVALEQPKRFLEAYGFKARVMIEPGDVTRTLRDVALAEPPSLLVIGSRGRWAPIEALFGGTTRALLEDGDIPLLIAA